MANGNGNGTITPIKIFTICVAITVAINGVTLIILQEHGSEIAGLHTEIDRKTDERYKESDAVRDFALRDYRMSRNEENIRSCLAFMDEHRREHRQ